MMNGRPVVALIQYLSTGFPERLWPTNSIEDPAAGILAVSPTRVKNDCEYFRAVGMLVALCRMQRILVPLLPYLPRCVYVIIS